MSQLSPDVELLRGQALAAVGQVNDQTASGPIDAAKRLRDWLVTQKDKVGMETLILAAESAWDFIAKYNFPQIPDFIEQPIKDAIRGQIRPVITALYMGS